METKKVCYKVDKGVLVTKEIIIALLNEYNYNYPKKNNTKNDGVSWYIRKRSE